MDCGNTDCWKNVKGWCDLTFCNTAKPPATSAHLTLLQSDCEQIKKLQDDIAAQNDRYHLMLSDIEDLYALRRVVFQIGKQLEGYELDEEDIRRLGKQLMAESRICPTCEGDGLGGDPEGGMGPCEDCNGATLLTKD
jgi:hypothetical protein